MPENEVDHKDRDKRNNAITNLREVSHLCNMRNKKIASDNKSGVTGVCQKTGKDTYTATIGVDGETVFLGHFKSKIEAIRFRWNAEILFDFPNCNTTSSAYQYLKTHKGLV